jgi:hypothetical protein
MGKDQEADGRMATTGKTQNLSQPTFSETVSGGTVCRKAARTGVWGSGEATSSSTRNQEKEDLSLIFKLKLLIVNAESVY